MGNTPKKWGTAPDTSRPYLVPRYNGKGELSSWYIRRWRNGKPEETSLRTTDFELAQQRYDEQVGKPVASNRRITCDQAFTEFAVESRKRGAKTVERHEYSWWPHLSPELGSRAVAEVTPKHVIAALRKIRKKRSQKTGQPLAENSIYNVYATAKVFFRWCREEPNNYCLTNPVDHIGEENRPDPPSQNVKQVTTSRVVRHEVVDRLAENMIGSERTVLTLRTIVLLMPELGARLGEVLSLKVADLNFFAGDHGIVSFERTLNVGKTYTAADSSTWFTTLKGDKGTIGDRARDVALSEFAREVLEHYLRVAIANRWVKQGHLLFPTSEGTPYTISNFGRKLRNTAKRAKLSSRVVSHYFRHTYVSQKLEAGHSLDEIAVDTGDDPNTLRRVYGHLEDRAAHHRRMAASGRKASEFKGLSTVALRNPGADLGQMG
jgi:integrase